MFAFTLEEVVQRHLVVVHTQRLIAGREGMLASLVVARIVANLQAQGLVLQTATKLLCFACDKCIIMSDSENLHLL